jgi:hypothetical protein
MKKLYKVTLEYTILVVADSEQKAIEDGDYEIRNGVQEYDSGSAAVVKSLDDLPEAWSPTSLPYGETDVVDQTIADFLDAQKKLS